MPNEHYFLYLRCCRFKTVSLNASDCPLLQQLHSNKKKRVANFSRRSTYAVTLLLFTARGRAEGPNNYHFKLFSQQVLFFLPMLCLEDATLSKYGPNFYL